jgi:hypothetical protein
MESRQLHSHAWDKIFVGQTNGEIAGGARNMPVA